MTTNNTIANQLSELAVELTGRVAELLALAAKDMEPTAKTQVLEMIETNLPTVVTNTVLQTTVLHSAGGVDHLKQNLDQYAHQFAQRFIHNQM
jgi:hydroxypyruvate isomerase